MALSICDARAPELLDVHCSMRHTALGLPVQEGHVTQKGITSFPRLSRANRSQCGGSR